MTAIYPIADVLLSLFVAQQKDSGGHIYWTYWVIGAFPFLIPLAILAILHTTAWLSSLFDRKDKT